MDTAPETTTAEPVHEHSAAYARWVAAMGATKAAERRALRACGPDTAAQKAVAALRDVARAEAHAWGDYLQERAYQRALDQIDGLEYHLRLCLSAAYNGVLLINDLRERAGQDGRDAAAVRWSNPLGNVLHRLAWVRSRCVPKDTTSRTELGEELEKAIARLTTITSLDQWTPRRPVNFTSLAEMPYWKPDDATREWVHYYPDGTEYERRPMTDEADEADEAPTP